MGVIQRWQLEREKMNARVSAKFAGKLRLKCLATDVNLGEYFQRRRY